MFEEYKNFCKQKGLNTCKACNLHMFISLKRKVC